MDPHYPPTSLQDTLGPCIIEVDDNTLEFSLVGKQFNASWLTVVADWDMGQVSVSLCLLFQLNTNCFTFNIKGKLVRRAKSKTLS